MTNGLGVVWTRSVNCDNVAECSEAFSVSLSSLNGVNASD